MMFDYVILLTIMNNLAGEKSPYLLQHVHNPVNWMGWCEEAFKKAKQRDVPIFLSIGYSTCHWCHVMERESFADEDVAEVLNKNFVCIKVDREQRPDIDKLYMEFCHILTGSGGWPLNIIITPDKRPFYAFTYLPKYNKYNMIGLIELAEKVSNLWNQKRQLIESTSDSLVSHLQSSVVKLSSSSNQIDYKQLSDDAFKTLKKIYDYQNGGFGSAPKFPMPVYLLFLMNYYKTTGLQDALDMVITTLNSMQRGGIYDHIGQGFHRYSTDAEWKVPHFEKMLYDQAMLLLTYSEAYKIAGISAFKDTANNIITYVLNELLSPTGLFYTAQDADTDGHEGLYYLWSYEELKGLLNVDEFVFFKGLFEITEKGNFSGTGKNVLFRISDDVKDRDIYNRIIYKLYEYRNKREKPFIDKKFLTDCNALMIYALSKSSVILDNELIFEKASIGAEYIISRLFDAERGLAHYSIDDYVDNMGFLDDYAYLIKLLIELYRIKGVERHIKTAIQITDYVIDHFLDKRAGGFYFTDATKEVLLIRLKDITDSVVPSGNGIMMSNLLHLWQISGISRYKDIALSIPLSASATITNSPLSCSTILSTTLHFNL